MIHADAPHSPVISPTAAVEPTATTSPEPEPEPTTAAAIGTGVAGVRAVIQEQLDEVARNLSKGQSRPAENLIGAMQDQLAGMRRDNKVTGRRL